MIGMTLLTPSTRPQRAGLTFACAALLTLAAHAATERDTPADYAYSLPVQTTGKQGVVAFKVPQVVYLNALTAGLDDVRVFDAQGAPQPFSLQRPQAQMRTQRSIQDVAVFPIRSRAGLSADSGVELDIRTNADGRVISVRTNGDRPDAVDNDKNNDDGPVSGLILDFGTPSEANNTAGEQIAALRFMPPPGTNNYNAEIWLEISGDLKTWHTLGAADIGWLTNDNAQTLTNDRLDFSPFNPRTHRYARLTWRKGDPLVFPTIQAERLSQRHDEPYRETLWIKPTAGRIGSDLAYPASIALPVDQISLRLGEPNIVYPMTLGRYVERASRVVGKKTELAFQPLVRSTFYQIEQDEQTRRSGPLPIALTQMAEWIVRPQNASATAKPELGLSWQPGTIVFLAGGTPPYRVSVGRADARPASQPLAQVAPGFSADELKEIELAQLGEMQKMDGGAPGETASELADKEARNRRLALWGLLVVGVLVLAGMTWRLVQQMKMRTPDTNASGSSDKPAG